MSTLLIIFFVASYIILYIILLFSKGNILIALYKNNFGKIIICNIIIINIVINPIKNEVNL
jgi:hypothetical protein